MPSPLPRNEDGLLYRCSYRPGDTEVAAPYELEEDPEEDENGRRTYSLHGPNLHFRVDHSVIHILTSDANPGNNIPQPHTRARPKDDKSREMWLRKLGEYIAAVMFGKLKNESEKPFVLADFPDDIAFYLLEKTRSDKPGERRTDVYLRSQAGLVFATPHEFARHSMWLIDGQPESAQRTACLCKYCDCVVDDEGKATSAPQRPITQDLRALSGYS
ncbi:hypothetical protein PENSPDRAFT_684908 [Peniophora sp. CONT]|nr:hypothetical protein PENSPDRAFT_684908 [Peniophora sp. CONT]